MISVPHRLSMTLDQIWQHCHRSGGIEVTLLHSYVELHHPPQSGNNVDVVDEFMRAQSELTLDWPWIEPRDPSDSRRPTHLKLSSWTPAFVHGCHLATDESSGQRSFRLHPARLWGQTGVANAANSERLSEVTEGSFLAVLLDLLQNVKEPVAPHQCTSALLLPGYCSVVVRGAGHKVSNTVLQDSRWRPGRLLLLQCLNEVVLKGHGYQQSSYVVSHSSWLTN